MMIDGFGPGLPVMDDDLFRRFCSLIHDTTGLSFNEGSRFFLEKRVENRLAVLQLPKARDYYQYLQYDSDRDREWDAFITLITTNETYFMREERQLRCFQREILPAIKEQAPGRRVRIWSAGCSSGEEPYTVAILVKESGLFPGNLPEIYATDINTKVLNKAKEGLYTDNSFRAVGLDFKRQWFTESGAGRYQICDEIRRQVTFARFNLFEDERYALLSPFDVIFCRNVIIYFDLEAKVKVVNRFHERLKPTGYLLLGHSESLISITDKFKLIHLQNDLVYMKEVP